MLGDCVKGVGREGGEKFCWEWLLAGLYSYHDYLLALLGSESAKTNKGDDRLDFEFIARKFIKLKMEVEGSERGRWKPRMEENDCIWDEMGGTVWTESTRTVWQAKYKHVQCRKSATIDTAHELLAAHRVNGRKFCWDFWWSMSPDVVWDGPAWPSFRAMPTEGDGVRPCLLEALYRGNPAPASARTARTVRRCRDSIRGKMHTMFCNSPFQASFISLEIVCI